MWETYLFAVVEFLSTPSARRATAEQAAKTAAEMISIHALREEGDLLHLHRKELLHISIHALREEGDGRGPDCKAGLSYFYPRPPRGGRRKMAYNYLKKIAYFYPRPPRGGRQQKQRQNLYFLINYTTFCTNLEEP